MTDFETLYYSLFNSLSKILELLDSGDTAGTRLLLISTQQECEELYIKSINL